MFNYRAEVVEVYDGDTITCKVDLGFKVTVVKKIRLFGIDTPELRGADKQFGRDVRDYLRSLILNKHVILQTYRDKTGKYGRYLATVFHDGVNVNEHLVDKGFAKRYTI